MSDSIVKTNIDVSEDNMVMNQIPTDIVGESPLHHADFDTLAKTHSLNDASQVCGVRLRERKHQGLLTLRCKPDDKQLIEIEALLGVALPRAPLTSSDIALGTQKETIVRWISPDEWFISVPMVQAFALERAFQTSYSGHVSLVNVSGGFTMLHLSGERAMAVLKKSTVVDVHPKSFPVGKVVTSVFAKSTAIIRRTANHDFELIVRRSFADYCWLWIQDASLEYGLAMGA